MSSKDLVVKNGTIVLTGRDDVSGAFATEEDIAGFLAQTEEDYKAVPGNETAVVEATYGGIVPGTKIRKQPEAPIFAKAVANMMVTTD
jgi:hypothetical protein